MSRTGKIALSKFDIGMIAAAVTVTLLGVGGYLFLGGQLDTARSEAEAENQNLRQVLEKSYLPSESNIKTLTENNQFLSQALSTADQQLKSKGNQLATVEEKDPVLFQQALGERVAAMTRQAKAKAVTLPKDFYFGFSKFTKETPSRAATVVLGKQLLVVEHLADRAMVSGVKSIEEVQRTFDEGGGTADVRGGSGEELRGKVYDTGLYRVYPFRITVVGYTTAIRRFLNGLQESPYVFVVRAVDVFNLKPVPSKMDELKAQTTASDGKVSTVPRFVFGDEQARVAVWVDLIEWVGVQGKQPVPGKAQTAPAPSAPAS
jgi:hypothetical protein